MSLSWIARTRRTADVDALIARGRYAKAVKVLRAGFEGRQPTLAERLRFADVLVLADRGGEALPVLLGVADEQARYGFHDKALEALRRAEAIDPRHPAVRNGIREVSEAAAKGDRPSPGGPPGPTGVEEGKDWGAALDGAFAPMAPATERSAPPSQAIAPSELPTRAENAGTGAATGEAAGAEPDLVLPETALEPDEPEIFVPEDELEPEPEEVEPPLALAGPGPGEPRPLLTEDELEREGVELSGPAVATQAERRRLLGFLQTLGRKSGPEGPSLGATLFSGLSSEDVAHIASGLNRRRFAPGDVLVTEGDPGDSVFVIARGSVRVLVLGGHGQPFDVRRLDEGDSFGEVAVLSGWPRTATVVAATAGEALQIGREALGELLTLRPEARALLEVQAASRDQSPEEKAVRSLPAEAADPERAATALRTHFGGSDWSFRVRLHLAQLMLDVGRLEEALAILGSVAEDLARHGHAQKAIAVLKRVEWIRRHGLKGIPLSPPKKGRRRSSRPRAEPGSAPPPVSVVSPATTGAAFREWIGSILRETHALAARPAPSSAVEEGAEGEDDRERERLARHSP